MSWDYLIITASSDRQADAYREQLSLRQELGFLAGICNVLVVPDPDGCRVGSGGSTLFCLLEVLNRELEEDSDRKGDRGAWLEVLESLRILIVHAGGDARRLPPYGPCGKSFVPLPVESARAVPVTVFDRQLPIYLGIPEPQTGRGQVIITSGDVLLDFDPESLEPTGPGLTGLATYADPALAANHGVYSRDPEGRVRRFLQKPSVEDQVRLGAVTRFGKSLLDIGIFSFDAETALRLLELIGPRPSESGELLPRSELTAAILDKGLDFYREICCAMGSETDLAAYREEARRSVSRFGDADLEALFAHLGEVPFSCQVVNRCGFFHFGTLRQLVTSGSELVSREQGFSSFDHCLSIQNITEEGDIDGSRSWVEGCRVRADLQLGGDNVLVGLDLDRPIEIPQGACFDVTPGTSKTGQLCWFVRCYGMDDTFQQSFADGIVFCGLPMDDWMVSMDVDPVSIWDAGVPPEERTLWTARLFPAIVEPASWDSWVWMVDPAAASTAEKAVWREAQRFSCAEIAELAEQESFHERRLANRAWELRSMIPSLFRLDSGFSARELALVLSRFDAGDRKAFVAEILNEAFRQFGETSGAWKLERLELSRIFHSLGSAMQLLPPQVAAETSTGVERLLDDETRTWLESFGVDFGAAAESGDDWTVTLQNLAFTNLSQTILLGDRAKLDPPRISIRSDEIIWGRAPARLDLGGGWTDTPPYALENGGCVLNVAVNLNGQPPIHAYARTCSEPHIKLTSIDHGVSVTIRELEELHQYRTDGFGLAKAALVLSGFSTETGTWPRGVTTLEQILEHFGGGIELTTLAAIPSGSGLGTSSVMAAVLVAVLARLTGREPTQRDLFNRVLQLEQELTTGGGWQDQIGGCVGGTKLITTRPGLVPDPMIHFVPSDLIEPTKNGGQTLLLYTGIRRLAKNILHEVVGRYLDRNRETLATYRNLQALPHQLADALSRRDMPGFGKLIGESWELNKELDPNSTTPEIESLLEQLHPHIQGAKLLGAGGGGFLAMICSSSESARHARRILSNNKINDRKRFFDYSISQDGLELSVC